MTPERLVDIRAMMHARPEYRRDHWHRMGLELLAELDRLREANALTGELADTLDAANAEIARLREVLGYFEMVFKAAASTAQPGVALLLSEWKVRAAAALAPTPHQAGEKAGEEP